MIEMTGPVDRSGGGGGGGSLWVAACSAATSDPMGIITLGGSNVG